MDIPRVSSALKSVDLRQIPPPMIIGERVNTQGSRRAKRMVLENDYDGLVDLAREQVDDGAHCLDICVATTERSDELEFMKRLVKQLSIEITAPLVIDSTDPDVIAAAVNQIPGRPIINSINLEGDGQRFARLAPIMSKYGIPAIALCIGPKGMAKSPQQKLETAELLYNTGQKYGLKAEQFIFDVLTFTLATGEEEFLNAGRHTLEGIRLVKDRFPNSFTTLGLSNISFGLIPQARKILNSVFLHHAVKVGLDTVIVNAKEIIPYSDIAVKERELAEALIFNTRRDALAELVSYYENTDNTSTKKIKLDVDPSWPANKRANFRVVNRLKDGIQNDVVCAIAENLGDESIIHDRDGKLFLAATPDITHVGAIKTLNDSLLPAMKEVGDKFGAGQLILPFVLKSAECMKAAVGELEKYLLREEGTSKGKLVLGTVYGDVHDIGKNLVKTIFQNNGYDVYDLGKQVPLQRFVEEIERVKPDAVGLSALLVSTSKQMQLFVDHARDHDMHIPILCGGAAINSNYINRIAKNDHIYQDGVFYCNTMFEGLKTMDTLLSDQRDTFLKDWNTKITNWKEQSVKKIDQSSIPKSNIVPKPLDDNIISDLVDRGIIDSPIHLGPDQIDIQEIFDLVDKKTLFKMSWGIRGRASAVQEQDADALFEEWKAKVIDQHLFEPNAVYGYFRCHGKDSKLIVESNNSTITLDFPRSTRSEHLCLADYFAKDDIVAFQAVTVGNKVADIIDEWNRSDRYTDAYYLHGLAVASAEALAEWINYKIKADLGLDEGGLRYSWGYSSCPDISQHNLVWKILHPEESGMTLTSAGQIIPEQSTAAIIVHHRAAKYFEL